MTFAQYPDDIAVEIMQTSTMDLGEITPTVATQLQVYGLQVFSYGTKTNESLVVKAYQSAVLVATSEVVALSDLPTTTDYFYGWLRFTYAKRFNFISAAATRFEIVISNYTFSESNWFAAVYDWPTQMGYKSSPSQINDSPFAIDLYGAS